MRDASSTRLIKVQYHNETYDYIPAISFQRFLDQNIIKRFKRASGWIDPIADFKKLRSK